VADFQTHITASTATGVGYAAWGYYRGVPWETAFLAGGLCSIAGMLPDLDSDSGVPNREMFALIAALAPALMLDRFQQFGWRNELIAVATILVYCAVRFGLRAIFKHFTVHRGMWHSVPACCTAGLITFLLCSQQAVSMRIYLAVAVMFGFASHLLLDEIWSINFSPSKVGLKTSWGTAMKFWGDNAFSNFMSYVLLLVCGAAVAGDPRLMEHFGYHLPYDTRSVEQNTRDFIEHQLDNARRLTQPNEHPQPWR
jgi:LexA-binding, inner membrane-associated putative hydrolase